MVFLGHIYHLCTVPDNVSVYFIVNSCVFIYIRAWKNHVVVPTTVEAPTCHNTQQQEPPRLAHFYTYRAGLSIRHLGTVQLLLAYKIVELSK